MEVPQLGEGIFAEDGMEPSGGWDAEGLKLEGYLDEVCFEFPELRRDGSKLQRLS